MYQLSKNDGKDKEERGGGKEQKSGKGTKEEMRERRNLTSPYTSYRRKSADTDFFFLVGEGVGGKGVRRGKPTEILSVIGGY